MVMFLLIIFTLILNQVNQKKYYPSNSIGELMKQYNISYERFEKETKELQKK